MKYETIKAEVMLFDNEDIVTGSKNCAHKDGWNNGNGNAYGYDNGNGHGNKEG